jgi:hypothetical protein
MILVNIQLQSFNLYFRTVCEVHYIDYIYN